ncbi:TonB-dependent receptor plug domain-containing protein, partial [Novacetimonas hansenii]|uniref:TonB-dependent receptor plug domain-containing protein n=1 Tax=Novacetimonas hansenii TaxID=436 RepID=UPI0039E8F131
MRTRSLLLSSIALFAVRQSALAAGHQPLPAADDAAPVTAHARTHAASRPAATATPPAGAKNPPTRNTPVRHKAEALESRATESVAVTGRQLTGRDAEQAVSKAIMRQYVPGTSAYKMLDRTPGVSFTSTDPFGIDSFGANLYVRGFFMNQMGVTVDGVPLNDQTYQSVSGMSLASSII